MKKYDLIKILFITLLVVTVLSWIIPAGSYVNGVFKSSEVTNPIGLYDLFRLPTITPVTFIQFGILFLGIGGFYGVLNKTGAYTKLVEKITDKFEKRQKTFLIFTIILFAVLTSVVGLPNVMFILVPFFIAVLLKLGYSKITAFAATVGAILVGQIGTTFSFSIWGFLKYAFEVKMTDLIFARIILLAIVTALFIILVKKNSTIEGGIKKALKSKEEKEIPLYIEQEKNKKSIVPLVIISLLAFVFLIIGLYNWYYAFEIELFGDLYESIMTFTIFEDYPLFNNLLGSVSEIGFFSNYDLVVILLISSLLIGWIYGLKLNDIFEGLGEGFKQMFRPALYSMLSCIIFAAFLNMSGTDFIYTIIDGFIGDGDFSLAGTIGSGLVSSFVYNDFYTLATNMSGIFGVYDANVIPVIAFVFQTMYAIVMIIAPTSIYLLAGLSYLNIPYKEWIKYIWKFLLIVFGIVVVIAFILTTLV